MASEADSWLIWFDEHAAALTLFARQFVASHADAEDVVQEVFVRYWQRRPQGVVDTKAYLFQCVKRTAFDLGRQNQRRQTRERAAGRDAAAEACMFLDAVEHDDERRALELALAELPADQREVVVLKVWGDLTFTQIGDVLSIPANTAASRYRYALGALRRRFKTEEVR